MVGIGTVQLLDERFNITVYFVYDLSILDVYFLTLDWRMDYHIVRLNRLEDRQNLNRLGFIIFDCGYR